jgi:MoaA/NifB/PqqE/SkfB family radical SAM enzyme
MNSFFENKYDFISSDITSNCNLRCPFCFNDYTGIKGNTFMSRETFKKVLSLLPLLKEGGYFYFSCLFEPTLHPNFIELLSMIPAEERKKVFFTTNLAKKLSDESLHKLSMINISHINISLDSLIPEKFELLRKNAKFKVFMDNLNRLVKIFSQSSQAPKLRYITILVKTNFEEVSSLIAETTEKYLSTEHEFRCFLPTESQDQTWKNNNAISLNDWDKVRDELCLLPYKYVLGPFSQGQDIVTPPQNNYEQQVYGFPPYLSLSVSSNGTISLLHMPIDIAFNLHEIEMPYHFFEKLVLLHSLDIERGKELQRIRGENILIEQLYATNSWLPDILSQLKKMFIRYILLYRHHTGSRLNISQLKKCSSDTFFCIDTINDKLILFNEVMQINYNEIIRLTGWAVDSNASRVAGGVIIQIDGKSFLSLYGFPRKDVAIALQGSQYTNCGFQATIPVREIGTGIHTIAIQILTNDQTTYFLPARKVKFELKQA